MKIQTGLANSLLGEPEEIVPELHQSPGLPGDIDAKFLLWNI